MKYKTELILEVNKIETRVQLLKNEIDSYEEDIKEFSKLEKIYPVNFDKLESNITELLVTTENMNQHINKVKFLNRQIQELENSANAKINHENYDKLIIASNELKERENERIDAIYNYQLKNIKNQNKVIKIVKVVRNMSICLAITFLVLRNHIFKIQMDNLSTNFSFLAVMLVCLILLCEYMFKNNKTKFDEIEAAHNNNILQRQMLKNDIGYILTSAECNSIEDFEQKLFNSNNYELEKISQLNIERDNIKEEINKISTKKSRLNKSVFETLTSANIKFDLENIWDNFKEFQFIYQMHELTRNELRDITTEYNTLLTKYRKLTKIYSADFLEHYV